MHALIKFYSWRKIEIQKMDAEKYKNFIWRVASKNDNIEISEQKL